MSVVDVDTLSSLLLATLEPNVQVRSAAEQQLEQLQRAHGFLTTLLHFIAAKQQLQSTVRLAAGIYLKNTIARYWRGVPVDPSHSQYDVSSDVKRTEVFSAEDKDYIRRNLVPTIASYGNEREDRVIRDYLTLVIRFICETDFPNAWPNVIPDILAALTNEARDVSVVCSGMHCLLALVKAINLDHNIGQEVHSALMEQVGPTLMGLLSALAEHSYDLLAVEIMWLVLKTLYHSALRHAPLFLRDDPQMFQTFIKLVIHLSDLPYDRSKLPEDERERKKFAWSRLKKKCVDTMYRTWHSWGNKELRTDPGNAEFAALIHDQYAVPMQDAVLRVLLRASTDGHWHHPRMLCAALDYLQWSFRWSVTWQSFKPNVEQFVTQVLFPMMAFSKSDELLLEEDPYEYIRKGFSIMSEYKDPAVFAEKAFAALVKFRPVQSLNLLMQLCNAALVAYQGNPGDLDAARNKDAALRAIGAVAAVLKKTQHWQDVIDPMLAMHVLPEFGSQSPFLRARAAWLTAKVLRHFELSDATFLQAFQGSQSAVRDPVLLVRIQAAVTIQRFVTSGRCTDQIAQFIPQLISELFALLDEIGSEHIVDTLQAIVRQCQASVSAFAVDITKRLVSVFMASVEEAIAKEDEEYSPEAADNSMLMMSALSTLGTILEAMEPELLPAIVEEIKPILKRVLMHADGITFMEDVVVLLSIITYRSPYVLPIIWELYPHVTEFWIMYGYDYTESFSPVFENIIERGADVLLQQPALVEPLLIGLRKVFCHPTDDAYQSDLMDAVPLCCSLLLGLRGGIDQHLTELISFGLKNDKPHIINNAKLAMEILQQGGVLESTLTTLIQLLPEFRRVKDHQVAVFAILSILNVPQAQLPALLASRPDYMDSLLNAALQMVQALPQLREKRLELLKQDEEAEGEYEDDAWNSDDDLEEFDVTADFPDDRDACVTGNNVELERLLYEAAMYRSSAFAPDEAPPEGVEIPALDDYNGEDLHFTADEAGNAVATFPHGVRPQVTDRLVEGTEREDFPLDTLDAAEELRNTLARMQQQSAGLWQQMSASKNQQLLQSLNAST